MKIRLLALMTCMVGCASIGQRAATTAAGRSDPGDGRVHAGQRAGLEMIHDRPVVEMTEGRRFKVLASSRHAAAAARAIQAFMPGHVEVAASTLQPGTWTRKRWTTLLTGVLSNEKLANAAMWIGSQPLRVKVSRGGFFVAVRLATP